MDSATEKANELQKNPPNTLKNILEKQSFALTTLLILGLFYTLYFISELILPIILAFLFAYLLAPLIRFLKKNYIPPQISAILIIVVTMLSIGYLFYGLAGPAEDWLKRSPEIFNQVSNKVSRVTKSIEKPIKNISQISEQIIPQDQKPLNKTIFGIDSTRVLGSIFSSTGKFFMQFAIMIMLLYFLLAHEDFLLIKIIKLMPSLKDKKNVIAITRETEIKIGVFLLVRVIINAGLALFIALFMYFLGMPNPILWGVMAAVLEFIPYLGVMVGTIIIAFVAIFIFDTLWQIILVPVVFFSVCSFVGNVITPILLGRQFTISPITVFLSVIFFGWMWGVIGGIIAVPLIVILKTIYENLFEESVVGELLEE